MREELIHSVLSCILHLIHRGNDLHDCVSVCLYKYLKNAGKSKVGVWITDAFSHPQKLT